MAAMATASHLAPGLQVTALDDDMEMTSEFQHGEDDIDIDLDLGGDYPQPQDDDLMLEDARSEIGHEQHQSTYADNDDVMFDDELDGMIQDNQDNLTIPDEHLTDVSEIGHEDAAHTDMPNQAIDPNDVVDYDLEEDISRESRAMDQALLETEAEYEQTLDAIAPTTAEQEVPENLAAETAPAAPSPPQLSNEQPVSPLPAAVEPAFDIEATSSNFVAANATQNEEHRHSLSAPGSPGEKQNDQDQAPAPESSGSPLVAHDVSQESALSPSQHEDDIYQTHSNNPLHPVIVIYHDNQISLFPPREEDESQTFFLQDESIAHQSIYELLQACRTVLGDTIREEEELEMDIAVLGLCISEDCTFAPTVSFAQILDTYTLLNQQDGVHEPDPLYMTLSTKTRFSSRFNQLNTAALQGKGISQLTLLGHPDEDDPEYPPNEAAENEHSEENSVPAVEQEQKNHPTEGDQSEYHDGSYAEYHAPESHSPAEEGDGDATYASAEAKSEDELDFNNQIEDSTLDGPTESHLEAVPEDNGTTENDASVAKEQVEGEPEHEVAAPESHENVVDEEDLIDYSDDEENADQTHDGENSGSGPSSASSTVQGDTVHSPKDPVDLETKNQPSHFEDDLENLDEFDDDFGQVDADAATLDGHHGEVADAFQPDGQGQELETEEQDQEFQQELEKELERELEKEDKDEAELDFDGEIEQPYGFDDVQHEGSAEQEAGFEFGESFDENYAPDFEEGQYALHEEPLQGQEHDVQGQESHATHGEDAADNGGDGAGLGEVDYEDDEHGDFDYPEFNDEAMPRSADVLLDVGNESDSIDYDDDEDESPPEAPATGTETSEYRPSASPPNKRSRDEQEDDYQDLRKKTRLD